MNDLDMHPRPLTSRSTFEQVLVRSFNEGLEFAYQVAKALAGPSGDAVRPERISQTETLRTYGSERAAASEPRERSAPAKRRARERVGESEGRSPSAKNEGLEFAYQVARALAGS
jgi:hypothetical protein